MGDLTTTSESIASSESSDDSSQFLTFHTQSERFAIGILDVQEIIEVTTMTRVPMTPSAIRGIINLRGNVVPVVDLASRLGRGPSSISKRSCIVLVEVEVAEEEVQTIGMLVDEVNEILEIADKNQHAAPDFGTDIRTDFIHSMGQVDDIFIILLEINNVLAIAELSSLTQQSGGQMGQSDPETEEP